MGKKVILFYPRTEKHNIYPHLPLPVLSIASDLLNSGFRVEIIDERLEPDYKKRILKNSNDISLFGVSVMTGYQIKGGLEASRFIKSLDRKIPVVWGGWHVSMVPEQTLRNPDIDAGVIGPGEGSLQQLMEKIDVRGLDYSELILDKEDKMIVGPIQENFDRLQPISRSALGLVNISDYIHPSDFGIRTIFWVTSRGCPFKCGFCCSLKVYKKKWIGLGADIVIDDLQWLVKEHGINGVNFVDTNFFVDKNRILDIAGGMIERRLSLKWAASVRVDQINLFDKHMLELLKKSGCAKLLVGAESGSKEALDLIDKNIDVEDVYRMSDLLAQAGMIAEIYVMAGFPLDPDRDLRETLLLVKKIKKLFPNHQFTSFLYTPYPGTPMFDLALSKGLKMPSSLEGWVDWNILEVKTPWIRTKGYGDQLHSFIKMYYPLAFPSDALKMKFRDAGKGRLYWLLHKLESFRVKKNFFLFPVEWRLLKFLNRLKARYKLLHNLGGFR